MMASQNTIRILSLLPGDGSEEIRCTTHASELGNEKFSALSYAWGCSVQGDKICVDNESVNVTTNLYEALNRLRHKARPRQLWIDQLCIDQGNTEEKARQVGQMRNIYSRCSECLLWLGDFPSSSGFTIHGAEMVLQFIRYCAESQGWKSPPGCLLDLSPTQLDGLRCAFEALFRTEWWNRIWTVQEAVLPGKCVVVWGSLSMDWRFFINGARELCEGSHPRHLLGGIFSKLHGVKSLFTSQVRGLQFAGSQVDSPLDLIQRWRHRKATDPRDKIYGLMGLFPVNPFPSIPLCDYSILVEDLYQKITFDLLCIEGSLRPLVELRPDAASSSIVLPSWTINFAATAPVDTRGWWWDPSQRYCWYDASCGMELSIDRIDRGTLHGLRGVKVDTIYLVGNVLPSVRPDLTPLESLLQTVRSWKKIMQESQPSSIVYSGSCPRNHAFWRCLVGNVLRDEFPVGRPGKAAFAEIEQFCNDGSRPGRLVLNSLCRLVTNQAFFTTYEGYFGIGQPDVREGDEVWVLYGSRMPFLLRPVRGSRQPSGNIRSAEIEACERALVGSCYLDGIMEGQMVRGGQTETTVHLV